MNNTVYAAFPPPTTFLHPSTFVHLRYNFEIGWCLNDIREIAVIVVYGGVLYILKGGIISQNKEFVCCFNNGCIFQCHSS